jgi:hypothetical protein
MSKLMISICLVLLSSCANKAVKEIAIPTKQEDFKFDRYKRLTCGGYAILDYALEIGGSTSYYKENTSEFVCEHPNSPLPSCPPPNWYANGCDKYAFAYRRLAIKNFSKTKP